MKTITEEDTVSQGVRSAQAGMGGKLSEAHSSDIITLQCPGDGLVPQHKQGTPTPEGPRKDHNSISIQHKNLSSILIPS